MNTSSPALFHTANEALWRHSLRIHLLEAWSEFRRTRRMPSFVIPSLLFPWMFYTFFGIIFNSGNNNATGYLLVTYACFGVIGPALFGFGMAVAVDRERGLLALKRALPMPISAYFCAKIFMSLMFACIILAGLFTIAFGFGGLRLDVYTSVQLSGLLLIGVLPFCAMGLAIGLWVNATAAPAVVNLLYLPMAFLSGLWIPIHMLPSSIQQIAWLLPPYHFSQLTLSLLGYAQGYSRWLHLAALGLFTLLFLSLARYAYQRISGR